MFTSVAVSSVGMNGVVAESPGDLMHANSGEAALLLDNPTQEQRHRVQSYCCIDSKSVVPTQRRQAAPTMSALRFPGQY